MTFDPSRYPHTLRACVVYFLQSPRPRTLVVTSTVAWIARLAVGHWSGWDPFVLGLLLAWWPIQEWLIHVGILHFKPRTTRSGRKLDLYIAWKHRLHHRNPLQLEIVFIPWRALLGGIAFHVVLWPLVLPLPLALTTIALYLTMTTHYDWVHFICHTPYVPRSRFYKARWRHHRLHHFKNEHYWMGVSMLAGDWLFGTAPARDCVPTSKTCRTLGVEETLGVALA